MLPASHPIKLLEANDKGVPRDCLVKMVITKNEPESPLAGESPHLLFAACPAARHFRAGRLLAVVMRAVYQEREQTSRPIRGA
jgi:hypothetical protein